MDNLFFRLSKSKFRSSFKLKEKDIEYIDNKGMGVIKRHAKELIIKNLSSKIIINDGKQTPMKGHPVFIAQHATATCCRMCLYKWHKINLDKQLNEFEIQYIVDVIIKWIDNQYKAYKRKEIK